MTADPLTTAVSDTDKQMNQEPIPEGHTEDDTVTGEEMEEDEQETIENENLIHSHIIMRFKNSYGKQKNVGFLFKEVFTWLADIDPELYLETTNKNWKLIRNIDDFPTKETDFLKCFAPTNAQGGSGTLLLDFHLHSNATIE